jgi:hypothetical protein
MAVENLMSKKRYNNKLSDKEKMLVGRAFGLRFYRLALKKFGDWDGILRSGIITERELYKLLKGTNPSLQKIFILANKVNVRPFELLDFSSLIPGKKSSDINTDELGQNSKKP